MMQRRICEYVAPMSIARSWPGVAELGWYIYTAGGSATGGRTPLSSVERYDPSCNKWQAVAPMLSARCCRVASLKGCLYAVHDGIVTCVKRYDPLLNVWHAVPEM